MSLVLFVPWKTGGLWAEPAEGQQEPLLDSRDSTAGLLAEMASDDALKADQVLHLAHQPSLPFTPAVTDLQFTDRLLSMYQNSSDRLSKSWTLVRRVAGKGAGLEGASLALLSPVPKQILHPYTKVVARPRPDAGS